MPNDKVESQKTQRHKVEVAHVNQVKPFRAKDRPFDTVIQITTPQGRVHFLLPETKADELGQKLQRFAAQSYPTAGHA